MNYFILLILVSNLFFSTIVTFGSSDNQYENNLDGFLLFSPEYAKNTLLLNKNGTLIHQWTSNYSQSLATYLLENGSILRSCYGGPYSLTWGGGFTGRIEMIDWNNKLIWEFERVNLTNCLHNDIEVLPNGNILMIVWERISRDKAITLGCNPYLIPIGGFQTDYIIEVDPTFPKGGKIVWEWHVLDHVIQEYDSSKNNYGVISNHPELIDINYRGIRRIGHLLHNDFSHINSIEYIEEFDQVLLSSRTLNEIWIIDHGTTNKQAAGHTGGRCGKGGDLLYRWGNPQVYKRGNKSDQKLFAQHDAQWIPTGFPGEGHITLYNNGVRRSRLDYSSVLEINPPVDEQGIYHLTNNKSYGPNKIVWCYGIKNHFFYSPYLSSAQRLPNGNTLICNGVTGSFLEVTSENEIVWRYVNPLPVFIPPFNAVFKVQWYPEEYPGLERLQYDLLKET